MDRERNKMAGRKGFTLIELLVVVAIIVVLIAILIPAVGSAKRRAKITETTAQLSGLSSNIEQYYQVFNAYPGPAPLAQTISATPAAPTGTQNLLIGLSYSMKTAGTLVGNTAYPAAYAVALNSTVPTKMDIDAANPSAVVDYSNVDATGIARSNPAFYTPSSKDISPPLTRTATSVTWPPSGVTATPASTAAAFPTIIDHFNDPLPILYYRKKPGVDGTATVDFTKTPPLITQGATPIVAPTSSVSTVAASYFIDENSAYTKSVTLTSPSGNQTPQQAQLTQDALTFVTSTTSPTGNMSARGGYVLISAGPDRIYGPTSPNTPLANDDIVQVGGQ